MKLQSQPWNQIRDQLHDSLINQLEGQFHQAYDHSLYLYDSLRVRFQIQLWDQLNRCLDEQRDRELFSIKGKL